MKRFIDKYYIWIIITLLVLFLFKNCQSCSRNRTILFNDIQYENVIDSMNKDILFQSKYISLLEDSIKTYKIKCELLEDKIDYLQKSNTYFQKTNRTLIDSNKELIKEY